MGFQLRCGCVWEKKVLTCYESDAKCIRAGEYISGNVVYCQGKAPQHMFRDIVVHCTFTMRADLLDH